MNECVQGTERPTARAVQVCDCVCRARWKNRICIRIEKVNCTQHNSQSTKNNNIKEFVGHQRCVNCWIIGASFSSVKTTHHQIIATLSIVDGISPHNAHLRAIFASFCAVELSPTEYAFSDFELLRSPKRAK